VKFTDAEGRSQECFGNIVELGSRALRLEAARALEVGQHVTLHVVFPGQRHHSNPVVRLHAVVRKAHDEPNLHYDVAIAVLEAEAHERLLLYLTRPNLRSEAAAAG